MRNYGVEMKLFQNFDRYDKNHFLKNRVEVILLLITKGMSVIYILICISIFVAACFLYAFIKAVRGGQFDDDYTPSVRMLFDDEVKNKKHSDFETKNKLTDEKQV